MTTITREQQKQILIDTANHVISRDNTSPYSETCANWRVSRWHHWKRSRSAI